MDNATRRQLLQNHKQSGFPGSIIDVYKAYDQGIDLIGQFQQQQELQKPSVASTPQEQQAGLRPAHQAGNVNQSMAFPNVPPNASFNTVGMKAPIDIKQFSPQGNLVRSFDAVPPGVTNLKMGSEGGMVLETPAQMQSGGVRKYQKGNPPQAIAGAEPTELELAAAKQMSVMASPEMLGDTYLKETDPRATYYIDNELMDLNSRPWFTSQSTGNGPAWSAGTVSNLMRAQYPDFPDTVAHANYVNDVFEGNNNSNLNARRTALQRHFNEGSVLVKGRKRLSGENYRGLKKATTGQEYQNNKNSSIPLHGDVIIGVTVDENGKKKYQVQGGNIGDSLYVTEMSEKEIRHNYPMVLEQRFGGKRNPNKLKDRRKNLYRK
jgi:hypothetical protein